MVGTSGNHKNHVHGTQPSFWTQGRNPTGRDTRQGAMQLASLEVSATVSHSQEYTVGNLHLGHITNECTLRHLTETKTMNLISTLVVRGRPETLREEPSKPKSIFWLEVQASENVSGSQVPQEESKTASRRKTCLCNHPQQSPSSSFFAQSAQGNETTRGSYCKVGRVT